MNKNDQAIAAQNIRARYTEKEITRFDELKALDHQVRKPASIFAYLFGTISALIMGAGMSLVMTDIGTVLHMSETMTPGIVIGVVGMLLAIINYPIYKSILSARKKKFAAQIIALSDELIVD